jgi:hypothetical protein
VRSPEAPPENQKTVHAITPLKTTLDESLKQILKKYLSKIRIAY